MNGTDTSSRKAIRIIRDEHRSISAVLSGLQELAKMARDARTHPQFEIFHAMILYINEFPERMHHPKEDQHLFARLVERDPLARPLVDALQAEHVMGAQLVCELERSLIRFENSFPEGAGEFAAAIERYAQFHWRHMNREEREALPLAQAALTAQDWEAIAAAFSDNQDPIAELRGKDFERLYQRIVSLAPAPVGVGERWRKSG